LIVHQISYLASFSIDNGGHFWRRIDARSIAFYFDRHLPTLARSFDFLHNGEVGPDRQKQTDAKDKQKTGEFHNFSS